MRWFGVWLVLAACRGEPKPKTVPANPQPQTSAPAPKSGVDDEAHRVVFADRIAYSYVLLLGEEVREMSAPTKDQLRELVRRAFPGREHDEEVQLLLGLIEAEQPDEGGPILNAPELPPKPGSEEAESTQPGAPDGTSDRAKGEGEPADAPSTDQVGEAVAQAQAAIAGDEIDVEARESLRRKRRLTDLLGLDVELHPLHPKDAKDAIVDLEILREPILARDLSPEQLASLERRTWALVVRARYRNQHGVRGLRLLQTIVRLLAEQQNALIHDPDTRETVTRETFTRTRLQTKLGNVADQIPVVPFQDPAHTIAGKPAVRLATRGMRRFGSVDIELAGLPADPQVLQQATHFVYGVAFNLIKLGVYDRSGYAAELPEAIHIHYKDCAQAYASRDEKLPRCADCPEEVRVHLVERPPEQHDTQGHVVARVVAPRHVSDAPDYDQTQWVREALARVLGPHEPG